MNPIYVVMYVFLKNNPPIIGMLPSIGTDSILKLLTIIAYKINKL